MTNACERCGSVISHGINGRLLSRYCWDCLTAIWNGQEHKNNEVSSQQIGREVAPSTTERPTAGDAAAQR
jgi:predicted  nucleic acid-binding Zn-ribbon protein